MRSTSPARGAVRTAPAETDQMLGLPMRLAQKSTLPQPTHRPSGASPYDLEEHSIYVLQQRCWQRFVGCIVPQAARADAMDAGASLLAEEEATHLACPRPLHTPPAAHHSPLSYCSHHSSLLP